MLLSAPALIVITTLSSLPVWLAAKFANAERKKLHHALLAMLSGIGFSYLLAYFSFSVLTLAAPLLLLLSFTAVFRASFLHTVGLLAVGIASLIVLLGLGVLVLKAAA